MGIDRLLVAVHKIQNLSNDELKTLIRGTKYEAALNSLASERKRSLKHSESNKKKENKKEKLSPNNIGHFVGSCQIVEIEIPRNEAMNDEVFTSSAERRSPRCTSKKSPAARYLHNRNEKQRRADLKKSLDSLSDMLPGKDSQKYTTSEILKQSIIMIEDKKREMFAIFEQRKLYFQKLFFLLQEFSNICLSNSELFINKNKSGLISCQRFLTKYPFIDLERLYDYRYCDIFFQQINFSEIPIQKKRYLDSATSSFLSTKILTANKDEIHSSIFCSGSCRSSFRNTLTGDCYHFYPHDPSKSLSTGSTFRSTGDEQEGTAHNIFPERMNESRASNNVVLGDSTRLSNYPNYKYSNPFFNHEDY